MINVESEILQRIIAQKMFFLILFFRKKRMPAWQGTQSILLKDILNLKTLVHTLIFHPKNINILIINLIYLKTLTYS